MWMRRYSDDDDDEDDAKINLQQKYIELLMVLDVGERCKKIRIDIIPAAPPSATKRSTTIRLLIQYSNTPEYRQ